MNKYIKEIRLLLCSNYINVLLAALPFALASRALNSPAASFILNLLAIIPLESLLAYAAEEISLSLGQVLGGLLNAVFGTVTALIVRFSHNNSI